MEVMCLCMKYWYNGHMEEPSNVDMVVMMMQKRRSMFQLTPWLFCFMNCVVLTDLGESAENKTATSPRTGITDRNVEGS